MADFGSGYLSSDWGGGRFGDKGGKAGFGSGRAVKLAEGALADWEGVITEVLPGMKRVRLLLEFLGRETVAEARVENLLPGEISGMCERAPKCSIAVDVAGQALFLSLSDFRAQAKKAEDYVAQKVNGQLCDSIHSSYDVLSGRGHKLEVKLSILIQPNKAGAPSSTVWKWNRLFGSDFGLAPLKIQFVPLIPGGSVTKTADSCRR